MIGPRRGAAALLLVAVAGAAAGRPAARPAAPAEPLLEGGRAALEAGRYAEAAALLARAVDGDPPRAYAAWHLLGRAQLRLGEATAARQSFDEALRRAPRFSPARLGRAEALLWLGDAAAASAGLDDLTRGPQPLPRAVLLAAELALAQDAALPGGLGSLAADPDAAEDDRRAAQQLLAVVASPPGEAQQALLSTLAEQLAFAPAWRALAWARRRAGAAATAGAAFAVARELDESDPVAPYALRQLGGAGAPLPPLGAAPTLHQLLAAWERGERRTALAGAAQLLRLRPHLVPLRLLDLRAAEEEGSLWRAGLGYRALWDELGGVPTFTAGLARVAETLQAHSLAACAARAVVALRPGDGAAWYLLGVAEAGRGRREAALEAFDRALESGFEAARVELQRGELLFDAMQIEAALAAFRRAVELDPEAAEVIPSFALATLTADQQRDLTGVLELHLATHPDNADTLYALATLDLAAGRLGVAEERLQRLAAIAPGHLQLHYNLGQLYLRQGRSEAGREELARFATLRAAADRDWQRHNEAHRRRLAAEAARQRGDRAAEIALLEENLRQETGELADRRSLAVAYLAVGRAEEARRAGQAVLAELPSDEDSLLVWSQAAALLERPEEAAEAAARLALLRDGCAGSEGSQPVGGVPARRGG